MYVMLLLPAARKALILAVSAAIENGFFVVKVVLLLSLSAVVVGVVMQT